MQEFLKYNFNTSTARKFIRKVNKIKAEKPATKARYSEQTFLSDFEDPIVRKLRDRFVAESITEIYFAYN